MDPQTNLPELVEDLEVNIDELSETLQPLLSAPIHTTASSLPLLDKAKLYTLAAYSIESLLFNTLQASGVNAKEHAVFPELARLKGYFAKIKEVEARGPKNDKEGRARLDVGAAQRFIKHGLSGNDRYDLERAERMAKEKARAQLKARQINKKFDEQGEEVKNEGAKPKKRSAGDVAPREEEEDSEVISGLEESDESTTHKPVTKRVRVEAADLMDVDSPLSASDQSSTTKRKKRGRKSKKSQANSTDNSDMDQRDEDDTHDGGDIDKTKEPSAKGRGRPPKQKTTETETETVEDPSPATARRQSKRQKKQTLGKHIQGEEEAIIPPPEAPKTRSEMFNSLLDGTLAEKQKQKQKGKGRGKGKAK